MKFGSFGFMGKMFVNVTVDCGRWVTARELNYRSKVLKLSPVPNPPYD
ncbi:hypothetical protein [Planktothrix sp. FACHB-1355]|nr:hypothetical protein [Planktothrix sp. FACHB-1355]